jgi:hypothetical protein
MDVFYNGSGCGRLRGAACNGHRQEVVKEVAETHSFPSLTSTEEELLRSLIREEVTNGIKVSMCVSGCIRMKLIMWGLGTMYVSLIGTTIGVLFNG